MEIDELWAWKFNETPQEGCEIKCPECKMWYHHIMWIESSTYCEDCGEHLAMKCPNCHELYDHVWQDEAFEVKNIAQKAKNSNESIS